MIAPKATDDELVIFRHVCDRTGLDPFVKQIHAIKRWNADQGREAIAFQVGIDGFRLVAERTGEWEGNEGPVWCGEDGQWREVWLSNAPPAAAKVTVHRRGRKPRTVIVLFKEYVQRKKDGSTVAMWASKPAHMLGKCAEALGLRATFPQELSGVYAPEEIGDDVAPAPRPPATRPQQPQSRQPAPQQRDERPRLPAGANPELQHQDPDEPLTPEQLNKLQSSLDQRGDEYARMFLQVLGVEKLSHIPYRWLNGARKLYGKCRTPEALAAWQAEALAGSSINDLPIEDAEAALMGQAPQTAS